MATLTPLLEVERLSALHYKSQGTNTYLIGRGKQRILIDTGEGKPTWASRLKAVLSEERATIHQALLTHWHPDHVNGVSDLLQICPDAQIFKNKPTNGQTEIQDGQVFRAEGATLTAFHTPGHAVDHMVFILEEENSMFTGDNVLGHGTAVFEDLKVYIRSLQRMRDRVSGRGYPGHGAVIEDATCRITEYIEHRQQREDELLRVLRYGKVDVSVGATPERKGWTPMDLVKLIYKNVPEVLHPRASHGVLQVLMKLEDEGQIVHEDGQWSIEKSAL
ncbi:hypothetical protein N7495_003541 [Penicillium taxi]|uniref:uncharacterized protein n=1 Tax=Penicillium taxi TaxID=168475 RepID=UPI00254595DE|nr:uncharacterized protein N7495_003541 [Penicillium taxi]KAJ5898797.1 hypothetical protein N7495_003541 [Penicillium taxi]